MNTFSADEIYQMAQQIERDGAGYYRKAAQFFPEKEQKKLFEKLAKMEDKHLEQFTEMRNELQDETTDVVYDVDGQAEVYLRAIAEDKVFDVKSDPADYIKPDSSVVDILKKAIELEKNSIIFYIGLKDLVPTKGGKRKIEAIIQQETRHIVMLTTEIAKKS
jgi:rubrerythrin